MTAFTFFTTIFFMYQKETHFTGKKNLSEEEQLTQDPLTGLGNDYLFRIFLPDEFTRVRENLANGVLIAIKLDNIVEINVLHGRRGGDDALRAIAHLLENYQAEHRNMSHRVFRLGGPVFGYYIPACDISGARAAAEEIRKQVQNSELYLKRLTVSMGLVNLSEFFRHKGTSGELALQIELTALKRLGFAEQQGTNTICDSSKIMESSTSYRPVILIIEPDQVSIELVARAIKAAGFIVHICTDGENALSFIQSTPPNIIICEVMTPRLNGFTIREKLCTNALWNTIPFILISHKKNEEYIKKAVERDIRYFFRKPLSITEIVGLITNITRGVNR
ncbi:MAG: response regulator [Spirochaetales bacterium]|nr:response regulator [Spirochaetales bacterium]